MNNFKGKKIIAFLFSTFVVLLTIISVNNSFMQPVLVNKIAEIFNKNYKESLEIENEPITRIKAEKGVGEEEKPLYLSDIPYINSGELKSTVGYGNITMDKTVDNKSLKLLINGSSYEFEKGVFAHASSTLYYDLTNYSNYSYFTTWYGISNHMAGKGSVKFYIYTSTDGKEWNLETDEKPQLMNGSSNANFIKVNIKGKKYLKLYADSDGGNGQDHSLYADAKLVTEDYNEYITESLEWYDNKLKEYEGQKIEGEYFNLLLKRELVSKTGQFLLTKYARASKENEETLNWLMNNPDVLEMYIMGGSPDGGYYNSLIQLSKLYNGSYEEDGVVRYVKDDVNIKEHSRCGIELGYLYKKLVVSISLSHSANVYLWMQSNKSENVSNSLERYRIYKYMHNHDMFVVARNEDGSPRLNANGTPVLDHTPIFENLKIEELRYVVNNIIDDESIIWLNEYTQQFIDANPGKEQVYLQPHYYMNYIWPDYSRAELHDINNKDYYNVKYGVYKNWSDKSALKNGQAKSYASKGLSYVNPDASKINGIFDYYGVTYRSGLYKLWMNIEAGAVCGGISKIGSNIRGVHGLPSSVISQPGHAALIYYQVNSNGDGYWSMDNGITGWGQSGKTERMNVRMPLGWGSESFVSGWAASYIYISQDVINRWDNYAESKKLTMLADVYVSDSKKYEKILRDALKIESRNLDAWEKLIKYYMNDSSKTSEDYYRLAEEAAESLKYYPLPMYNILGWIKPYILKTNDPVEKQEYEFKYTLLLTRTLNEGAQATSSNIPSNINVVNPSVTNQVAKFLLGNTDTSLASFSFDGEDAEKIVLSNRFNGAGIRFDYSLDGGKNWTEKSFDASEEHKLKLTKEELEMITAENDIKVHIVGVGYEEENIYTIDITQGTIPTNLYKNDLENRVIGVNNLFEWRIKGENNWNSFKDDNPRFTGNKEVEIRVSATGTKLPSNIATYTFTEDNQPKTRTYITIDNYELFAVSSEATANSGNAIYAIDGNGNTRWHSNWNGGDSQRYIDIEIKPDANGNLRYISGLDYVPVQSGNGNGRIRHGKMYVSNDGKEWIEVADVNWGNENATKQITLQESIQAKYVRLQALTNWGDGRNFITAVMINLFEDLDGDRPRATVEYSTKNTTTEAVDVLLIPNRSVTIKDSEGNKYTKDGNGNYVFEIKNNKSFNVKYVDENGKEGNTTINVDWIVDYDFSFNGDNAGVISVGEKFLTEDGIIVWEYSIKGGAPGTWKTVKELSHKLTEEEINEMTSTDGLQLKIKLIKYNEDEKLDDLDINIPIISSKVSPNNIYANDLENKLFGINNDMEWRIVEFDDSRLNILFDNSYESIDGVNIEIKSKWISFRDGTPKFKGNKQVQVRYEAHEKTLPSSIKTYKFTDTEEDSKHTYIPVEHYTVSNYSSQTNRTGNYEVATNAIDGNIYTKWVTNRKETVNGVDKYIVIELDSPRYVSKLEAIGEGYSNTANIAPYGNIKDGSVYVSMDGENWTLVAECHDERFESAAEMFGSNAIKKLDPNTIDPKNPVVNVKVFTFEPVYAKYIKLKNDKSHDYVTGQTDGKDRDYFLDLNLLNIYEDSKQQEVEPIILIDYNIKDITNQDVVATIYSPNAKINVTSEGGETHTFTKNGEWEFTYEILDNNGKVKETGKKIAKVSGIDKTKPTVQVVFNEINPTRENVNATLIFSEEVTIENLGLDIRDENEYKVLIFNDNGTVELNFKDKVGNINKELISVNWIDRKVPTAELEYSTTDETTDPVTVTLIPSEEVTITNNGGLNTYTFKENGTFTFEFVDKAGNNGTKTVSVDWILEKEEKVEIEYSTTNKTNQNVIATLLIPEGYKIINNNGKNSYLFEENDKFIFEYKDSKGNINTINAEVNWINKKIPELEVEYDITEKTNKDVVATLILKDGIKIQENESNIHTFKENGSYKFEYIDEYGNIGTTIAEVSWINKEKPVLEVKYDITEKTNKDVTATLILKEGVKVTNNGSEIHVFKNNGTHLFEYIDEYGNIGTTLAEVNWINTDKVVLEVEYDINEKTNQDVTATLKLIDGVKVTNNGSTTHVFTSNGTHVFEYVDEYGNIGTTTAEVNWINKEKPVLEVKYDITGKTNKDVVATLILKEGIKVKENNKETYLFKDNGSYTFEYIDEYGNVGSTTATVNWIDKIAPTADLKYDITEETNQNVTVTLTPSEPVIITNNEGKNTYTFKDNGDFTFEYVDEVGNAGTATAIVNWINKNKPVLEVKYSTTSKTDKEVVATLELKDGIKITNNDGKNTYTFTKNGDFTFEYEDKLGNIGKTIATVDWIDEIKLEVEIVYDNKEVTAKDVVATIKANKPIKVTNNEGNTSYIFTKNDEFTFEYEDEYKNKGTIKAIVNWINKEAPKLEVEYSNNKLTNKNVIVTLLVDGKDIKIKNNDGKNTYTFSENGTFIFEYEDSLGNIGTTLAEVNWIDKTSPTATLEYDINEGTNKDVTVTLIPSETVTIKNNNGLNTYTFKDNGDFTFVFMDEAGNLGSAKASVNWIHKNKPVLNVSYSTTSKTDKEVIATLELKEGIKITNNNGSNRYIFKENGIFTFNYIDEYENEGSTVAKVDWIEKEKQPEDKNDKDKNNTSNINTNSGTTITTKPSKPSQAPSKEENIPIKEAIFENENVIVKTNSQLLLNKDYKLNISRFSIEEMELNLTGNNECYSLYLSGDNKDIEINVKDITFVVTLPIEDINKLDKVYKLNDNFELEEIRNYDIVDGKLEIQSTGLGSFIINYNEVKETNKFDLRLIIGVITFSVLILLIAKITSKKRK